MIDNPWIFAGGAAAMGLLASCWQYVRGFYQQIASRLIVSVTTTGYQSDALQLYLNEYFKASKFGARYYAGWMLHVQPKQRTQLVAMEVVGKGGRFYWQGLRPIWVCKGNESDDSNTEEGLTSRDYNDNTLNVTFIRGVFDADRLVLAACEHFNRTMVVFESESEGSAPSLRQHVHGTAGKDLAQFRTRHQSGTPSTAGRYASLHAPPAARLGDGSAWF